MTNSVSTDQSNESDSRIVRKHLTITKDCNDMLEELTTEHYASQSEAIRAAIKNLDRTHNGENERAIKRLVHQVEDLSAEFEELTDQIDELTVAFHSSNPQNQSGTEAPIGSESTFGSDTVRPEVQQKVYRALHEVGPATVPELAEQVEADQLAVRDTIGTLVNQGMAASTEIEGENQYQPADPSS